MSQTTDVIEQFIALASMNSYSRKERQVATYLVSRLKALGAEKVWIDDSAGMTGSDTGNVIARFKGSADGAPGILLCSHMDTIGSTDGMVPVIRDGYIYSNGETVLGADDKAGIAVILCTLERSRIEKIPHGDLEIVFTVQEETGLTGAKNLQADLTSDFGYILDGDGAVGTIIHRLSAKINLDMVIAGQAAHAGICPEEGINAIVAASTAISRVRSGRIDKETTSNFGTIRGGTGRNIVPDRVEIVAEVRSLDPAKLDAEVNAFLDTFQTVTDEFGAKLTVKQETSYKPFTIPKEHPAVTRAVEAADAIGIEPLLSSTGGGLDANIFNDRGLTCVGLGLGIENAHAPEEYIPAAQLEEGVRFLTAILKGPGNGA